MKITERKQKIQEFSGNSVKKKEQCMTQKNHEKKEQHSTQQKMHYFIKIYQGKKAL